MPKESSQNPSMKALSAENPDISVRKMTHAEWTARVAQEFVDAINKSALASVQDQKDFDAGLMNKDNPKNK